MRLLLRLEIMAYPASIRTFCLALGFNGSSVSEGSSGAGRFLPSSSGVKQSDDCCAGRHASFEDFDDGLLILLS